MKYDVFFKPTLPLETPGPYNVYIVFLVFKPILLQTVSLIFHSSVVEDADPPGCDISWNGTYLVPTHPDDSWNPNTDLLPGCATGDSREGYHMTYYWFHLLDWQFD